MQPSPGFVEPTGSWEGIGVSVVPDHPYAQPIAITTMIGVKVDGVPLDNVQSALSGESGWADVLFPDHPVAPHEVSLPVGRIRGRVELFWLPTGKRVVAGDME